MDMKIKNEWEKRSLYFKDNIKGVVLSSFPNFVNVLFHDWESRVIKEFFPINKKRANILDIGCGYGRLSFALAEQFKDQKYHGVKYYGVDISEEFVKLFNEKLRGKGRAILSSADNLSFVNKKFDLYVIVTCIIYMKDKEIIELVKKIKKTAKKDAFIIVIENSVSGFNYVDGFGLVSLVKRILGRKNGFNIKCRAFKNSEITEYFKDFYLVKRKECRLITLFLPLFLAASKFGLTSFSRMNYDINLPFLPSLYTAHIFRVKFNE